MALNNKQKPFDGGMHSTLRNQFGSLVVFGLAVHSVASSILFWANFPVEGIFPLELTLSDESINRGLVCAHMHFIARTQKILTFMSSTGECRQQKHAQHAPSTKTKCDYLNGWIKKQTHTQQSHPKMVNPRDIAGERRRRRFKLYLVTGIIELYIVILVYLTLTSIQGHMSTRRFLDAIGKSAVISFFFNKSG